MSALILVCISVFVFKYGQTINTSAPPTKVSANLDNGLRERIGNFSLELLYHTWIQQRANLILSPITIYTVLAAFSEGASGHTAAEIINAIRLPYKHKERVEARQGVKEINQWLQVNTNTGELAKINALIMDQDRLLLKDFQETAEDGYKTKVFSLDFSDTQKAANAINQDVARFTRGRITHLVDAENLDPTSLFVTSSLYFKGQWTVPFNTMITSRMAFLDTNGQKIGEVNMMYNHYTYPNSNIRELQARVIEVPYGTENRLSMLIMLPYPGVSLEDMFRNFAKVSFDTIFKSLSKIEGSDVIVDLFLPRFKIESNLDLGITLLTLGINDLFKAAKAHLPLMARTLIYVNKVLHKAEIEVTEDGVTASGVTAEFNNRTDFIQFVVNRPFYYMIIEKVTNVIVFGGLYKEPSLY